MLELGQRGIALITKWEVPVPYLYDDGGIKGLGNATVAIGILVHFGPYHEIRGVCRDCDQWPRQREPSGTWLTRAQMDALLIDKANARGRFAGGQNYVFAVNGAFPTFTIRDANRFDAMVSYTYNYGSFGPPQRMARSYYAGADMYAAFTDENYLRPIQYREGLLRRRKDEYALWSSNAPALPPPPPQEEDMKPFLCWSGRVIFVGPAGPRWITNPAVVRELARIFNQPLDPVHGLPMISLTGEAVMALGGVP